MVLTSAAFFGEKDLYVYKEDKEEVHYSYNRLRDEVEQFGTALDTLGIRGEHGEFIVDNVLNKVLFPCIPETPMRFSYPLMRYPR